MGGPQTGADGHEHGASLLPLPPAGVEWVPVQVGESGDKVFRRSDGAAYAKTAGPARTTLLEGECRRMEWLAPFGLGSADVLDWIASESGACLISGTIPGIPASALDADRLEHAWPSITRKLKAIHDLPADACPFRRDLARMMEQAKDVVARGAVNPDFLAPGDQAVAPPLLLARMQGELPVRLSQEAGDSVVCHGDPCLPNFLVDPETLCCTGFVDLGRLGMADRYADLALLLGNAGESWKSPAQAQAAATRVSEVHGIPALDRQRLEFYLRLDPLTWG